MSQVSSGESGIANDPRGRGFKTRATVEELTAWIAAHVSRLGAETIGLGEACGRVLARDLIARQPVPPFDRAAMDGYALRADETFGASAYAPAVFRRIGRSRPGRACEQAVGCGEAVEVATGAPMPSGADVVVPVDATRSEGEKVLVCDPVPRCRHVSRRGEDLIAGTLVLAAGRLLRPQHLGVLSAVGAATYRPTGKDLRPVAPLMSGATTRLPLLEPTRPGSSHHQIRTLPAAMRTRRHWDDTARPRAESRAAPIRRPSTPAVGPYAR
jgi:hypothetical protein